MISKERFKEKVEMIRMVHSGFNYEASVIYKNKINYTVRSAVVDDKCFYRVCYFKNGLFCDDYKSVNEVMDVFDKLLPNCKWKWH